MGLFHRVRDPVGLRWGAERKNARPGAAYGRAVRAGVDDVALHVPWAAERGSGKPRRRAAAQADAHRYLAPDAALHVQARERVLVRVEVVRAFALVVPRRPL